MCVIWGIPYLMIRVAVRELAPVTLVFLRTGLAAALLVPLAARQEELRLLLGRWRPLLAYTALSGERARLGVRRWLGLLVGIVGVGAIVGLDVGQINLVALGA